MIEKNQLQCEGLEIKDGILASGRKCEKTDIVIPDGVIEIDKYAFYANTGLKSITIPSSVAKIAEYAFGDCSSLESIVVDANNPVYHSASNCLIETSTKTLIRGCKNSVIPTDGSVTIIGEGAFDFCSELTSIIIPDNITSIREGAFSCCESLTHVTIPSSVTKIGEYAFGSCSSLENIVVDAGNLSYYISGNCLIERATKTLLHGCKNSVIPTDGSVTIIGEGAFSCCESLTCITIPNTITDIGDSAFFNCKLLASIVIPNSVTSIGCMAFYNCSSFTSLVIPNSVTEIAENAFYTDTGLKSITIPSSVAKIGEYAFGDCSSLESIVVDADNPVYHSADNCLIETSTKTLIRGCKNSVIPTDGSVTIIGEGAFNGCSALTNIVIPNTITNIGEYAFDFCSSLTSVAIPDGVTSIEECAFSYCSALTSITIPDSIEIIEQWVFRRCLLLDNINYCGTIEQWNKIDKSNDMFACGSCGNIIHCVNGDVKL